MKKLIGILLMLTLLLPACMKQKEELLTELQVIPRYLIPWQGRLLVVGEDIENLKNWKVLALEEGKTETLLAINLCPQEVGVIYDYLYVIGEETFVFNLEKKRKLDLIIPTGVPLQFIVSRDSLILQYPAILLTITGETITKLKIPEELHLISLSEQGMFFHDLGGSVFFVDGDLGIITEISLPSQKEEKFYLLGLQPLSGFASSFKDRTYLYISEGDKLKSLEVSDQISKVVPFEGKLLLLGNRVSVLGEEGMLQLISSPGPNLVLRDVHAGTSRMAILYSDELTGNNLLLMVDQALKARTLSLKGDYLAVAVDGNRILLGKRIGQIIAIP